MRVSFSHLVAAAGFLAAAIAISAPASAEGVMAACASDWKQAQAAGTTGGATWPQYLSQCELQRSASAAPASAPAPAPQSGSLFPWLAPSQPAAAPAAPAAGQSVMAACGAQWQQAKANGTTGGMTWQQFLARCRRQGSSSASIAPAPAPTAAPAPAPAQQSGSLFPWMKPTPPSASTAAPTGAGQFSTEAEARYRCPSDTIVWVNNESKIYHLQGSRFYGHTKKGAYMCQADANASGARVSRAHPVNGAPS